MAALMREPPWWSEPEAVEERRALIEAFQVEDLEASTADLVTRCEELEDRRREGEPVAVGDVAEVLLAQWSVSFQSQLAEAHREFFAGDYERLARAAQQGRAAALAVRDRFLTPDRIDARSLQQALELANAAAADLKPDRVGSAGVRGDDEDPVASGPGRNGSRRGRWPTSSTRSQPSCPRKGSTPPDGSCAAASPTTRVLLSRSGAGWPRRRSTGSPTT